MFSSNKKNYPREDEYGGIEIASVTKGTSHFSGDVLSEGFKKSIAPNEPISLPADEYDKLVGEIKNRVSSSVICSVLVGVVVTIFIIAFAISIIPQIEKLSLQFLPIKLIAIIIVAIIVIIGGIWKNTVRKSKIKNADYQPAAFEVQAKYSYTDIDNEHHYYIVLNDVWIEIYINIYKNVHVGDKIACIFACIGNDTLFAVSDYVL